MGTTENTQNEALLKVSGSTDAKRLASAVSHAIYDNKEVTLRTIGAGSVNQAIKAVAISNSFVGSRGIRLGVIPAFTTLPMKDGDVTAMTLRVIKLD